MIRSPLISVIVPVYKVERYLKRCVDSILAQTYDNLEIILVDDGSPDNCGNICDEYAQKDIRVKVKHKENGGLSDARNVGLKLSRGELVAFVDSDDWLSVDYFEVLLNNMKETDSDISICEFFRIKNENEKPRNIEVNLKQFTKVQGLEQLYGELYIPFVIACGKLYKKSLFEGKEFPIGKVHEDEYLTFRLIYEAEKICYIDKPMYFYWQRSDSIMSSLNINTYLNRIEAFESQTTFYEEYGFVDIYTKSLFRTYGVYDYVYKNMRAFLSPKQLDIFEKGYKKVLQKILVTKSLSLTKRLRFSMLLLSPRLTNVILSYLRKLKS